MSITSGVGAVFNPSSMQSLRLNSKISPVYKTISNITGSNTASSAREAATLRDWQAEQSRITREFNASEAAKNRDWQKMMSDTAHQREVQDLLRAGLNPVLSVTGGNGASVTSGATASSSAPSGAMGQVDTSATAALVSFLGSMLNQMTQLETARVSAESNQAIADKYTAMNKYTSELQASTQLTTANINAAASKYVADAHYQGTLATAAASKVVASIHAAAQKYGYDVNAMTQRDIASFNAQVNKEMQEAGFNHQFDLKSSFPENGWQYANAFGDYLSGNSSGRGFSGTLDFLKPFLSTKDSLFEFISPDNYKSSGFSRGNGSGRK